jgi:hypothetical protein
VAKNGVKNEQTPRYRIRPRASRKAYKELFGMKAVAPIFLLFLLYFPTAAQELPGEGNSLAEVRDKRNVLLVVFKSRVIDVDAGDRERGIIEDVLKADPEPKGRYRWVYSQLAAKLNKYARKYRSLSAARELSEADYVIFFNVVEFRRILNTIYPYGELFVIVKGSPEASKPPRVVWKARKVLFAEDAINDLIKDLRALRGET